MIPFLIQLGLIYADPEIQRQALACARFAAAATLLAHIVWAIFDAGTRNEDNRNPNPE